jgi:hypothetical protein
MAKRASKDGAKVIALNKPVISPEGLQKLEAEKRDIEAFLKNPENKLQMAKSAKLIQESYSNWFSVPQIVKIFKVTTAEAAKKLEMLMLFNMCVGKVDKGKPFFKIDINQRTQRTLLIEEIAETEAKLAILKEKLVNLN